MRALCERTGRGDPDAVMADWNFYLAYNLFRLAAILQGIAKRVVDGTASAPRPMPAGRRRPPDGRTGPGASPAQRLIPRTPSHPRKRHRMDFSYSPQDARNCRRVCASWTNTSTRTRRRTGRDRGEPAAGNRWTPLRPSRNSSPRRARPGLWNLFLPPSADCRARANGGLSNQEYAPLSEIMGRVPWPRPRSSTARRPDTGNMETIIRYGTAEHKWRCWNPLLEGEIRSAFAMTEPDVASSDATNIESHRARRATTT